jgi:hypothetical protein
MMHDITPPQPLLDLDPDLGQLLAPERLAAAGRDLRAHVVTIASGEWNPAALCRRGAGLLVVQGMVARELRLHDTPSAELFGPGDIIRTGSVEARQELLPIDIRWTVLATASIAVPDRHTARALHSYPEVTAILSDRVDARAERLAVTQAISQLTGVEMRIETLLWHLAERWGRVGTDGVIVPIALSHRMIGALIGARRPTVSTAIARLAAEHRLARRPDDSWVLTGAQPSVAFSAAAPSRTIALDPVATPPVAA